MPLVDCPACGNAISVAAVACPQCGHPNSDVELVPAGPKCYACSAYATTRCQRCGEFSCPRHLASIFVAHGHGGAYELRCEECHSRAETWQAVTGVLILIAAVVMLAVVWLGGVFR